MSVPVFPGSDTAVVYDGLETVTVEQINPDTGTAGTTDDDVTALRHVPTLPAGDVGVQTMSWTLVGTDMTFVPRERDVIEDGDGVRWSIGPMSVEGFTEVYECKDCTKLRG